MKRSFLSMLCAVVLIGTIYSCRSNVGEQAQSAPATEQKADLIRKYVDEHTFLDVDLKALAAGMASASRSQIDEEQMAQAQVAIYRFYRHVKQEDGYYVCDLKSGDEISLSAQTFEALKENLNEKNAAAKALRDAGSEVEVFEIDEAYLQSLLNS